MAFVTDFHSNVIDEIFVSVTIGAGTSVSLIIKYVSAVLIIEIVSVDSYVLVFTSLYYIVAPVATINCLPVFTTSNSVRD